MSETTSAASDPRDLASALSWGEEEYDEVEIFDPDEEYDAESYLSPASVDALADEAADLHYR